jgi:integrase
LLADLAQEGRYVFPGNNPDKPFLGLPKAWRRIVARANIAGLTPHGLRHASASVASDLGFAEPTIAALLGHGTHSVTGRYLHHLDSALLAAADHVTGEIAAMMTGRRTAPVPLRPRIHA